jgi:polysaccharide export outer membrane protein
MRRVLVCATLCLFAAGLASAQDRARLDSVPSEGSAPTTVPAATARAADDTGYKIGPEDVLDISVWKSPELSRSVPVRPDGKVSLPLVNDIKAAGLTPEQLRQELTTRLSEFIPKAAVVGAVRSPGRFELRSPATVLEMIAMAQGFTDFAERDRIVILRQNGRTTVRIPFRYTKVEIGTDQDNFFVQSGDIIVVP